jgi:methyltransferase (TIGR00027 family)
MEHFPAPLSREESDALMDRIVTRFNERGWGLWAVEARASGEFIGFIGLLEPMFTTAFTPCLEIGWRLAFEAWGHGYATEGARAVMRFAFEELKLEALYSFTVPGNVRSCRVMERLGMRRTPENDFEHPRLPPRHPLRPHIVYKIDRRRLETRPSLTAHRVAMRRAAHQVLDQPPVFEDPFALRILGADAQSVATRPDDRPSRQLRAFVAVRSRFAEDELARAVEQGTRQYVVLGAGLDTFALRNPHPDVQVFEVDHPSTQAWKQELLAGASIDAPPHLTWVPVDFETQDLASRLALSGFRADEPAFFAWLGVTMYLSREAFLQTLAFVASVPASGIVFDYAVDPAALTPHERFALEALRARVASAGEPFRLFFTPESVVNDLRAAGFNRITDLDSQEINERYLKDRADGLHLTGGLAHLISASH